MSSVGPNSFNAFLIYGPESSGNRLLHRLLIHLGCYGDGGHIQRLDKEIPPYNGTPIVWGKSIPSNYVWVDLFADIGEVIYQGYTPVVLVCQRDYFFMARSQVKNGRVKTLDEAYENIQKAYKHIHSQLYGQAYITVSYEGLIKRPKEWMKNFTTMMKLPWDGSLPEEIKDGNEKYAEL